MTEIQTKETTNVLFAGDRAALRQQKLHEVITEYNSKYKGELRWVSGVNVNLQILQPLITEALTSLDNEMKACRNPTDLESLVKLAHYLYSLQEANVILKKSIDANDFSPMISAKIEDFLSRRSDTFTL